MAFHELHPHTGTRARHERPIARELRKAMQARTTRWTLVPSYVLTRTRRRSWLVLSACPTLRGFPCPSTSWSLFRSFPLHWIHTRSPRRSFSFSAFLSRDLSRRHAIISLALFRLGCSVLQGTSIFLRCYPTSPPPPLCIHRRLFLLVFLLSVTQILRPSRSIFQKCSPARSRFALALRSMLLRLLQFDLICQNSFSIIEAVSGKKHVCRYAASSALLVGSNNISRPPLALF